MRKLLAASDEVIRSLENNCMSTHTCMCIHSRPSWNITNAFCVGSTAGQMVVAILRPFMDNSCISNSLASFGQLNVEETKVMNTIIPL